MVSFPAGFCLQGGQQRASPLSVTHAWQMGFPHRSHSPIAGLVECR